jgi:hypothetical protein
MMGRTGRWHLEFVGDEDRIEELLADGWEPIGGFLNAGYVAVLRKQETSPSAALTPLDRCTAGDGMARAERVDA